MVAIKNLVFLAVSVSAAAIRRDVATIQSDLNTVDTAVNQLTSDANGWSGSIFTAGTLDDDVNTLESDIKQTTTDVQATSALSDSDASAIVAYINSPLQGDISSALNALTAKKDDIDNDGLSSTVKGGIQDIKNDADALASALNAIFPSDQQSALSSAFSTIDTELQNAINEFS